MRSTRFVLALSLALSVTSYVASAKNQDISKVNGSISTESGQSYGDLDTVNGSIRIDDKVKAEDVETVNGSITSASSAQLKSAETVNGSINLGEATQVQGPVGTVNGALSIGKRSVIDEDISTVNGRIMVLESQIKGGISTVSGDITVGANSHVYGGILVEKPSGNWGWSWGKQLPPRIIIGPNARVDGELRFEREVELYVHTTAKTGKVTGAKVLSYTDKVPAKR
jgi:DUF4097 and DUF4098 domain-containing protein YvlB